MKKTTIMSYFVAVFVLMVPAIFAQNSGSAPDANGTNKVTVDENLMPAMNSEAPTPAPSQATGEAADINAVYANYRGIACGTDRSKRNAYSFG